jgi:hypothetical protein
MAHIVLLGDSIFDNAPYVFAGTEVQSQLRARLGPLHRVSPLARDGNVLADMVAQVGACRSYLDRLTGSWSAAEGTTCWASSRQYNPR